MEFKDWEPVYELILKDFGYSRAEDEASARELDALASNISFCDDVCLTGMLGSCATIVAGPTMNGGNISGIIKRTTLAVGIGTSLLMKEGAVPDLVVTDLDGDVESDLEANRKGAVLVAHAHGDNMNAIREFAPRITGRAVLTTQSVPFGRIRDFGGFTDGDRAVALVAHFGVRNIRLVGFDFHHPRPKAFSSLEAKGRKLRWAKRIIDELDERYGLSIEYL